MIVVAVLLLICSWPKAWVRMVDRAIRMAGKNKDGTDVWDDTKVARIAISCLRGQALKWIERIDHKDADGTDDFFFNCLMIF